MIVLQFSEFGRRISENGSGGTDHGAAGLMMAIGGGVQRRHLRHGADLNPSPGNPTLENNGARRHLGDRLPLGLRERDRQLAGRRLCVDPRRQLPQFRTYDRLSSLFNFPTARRWSGWRGGLQGKPTPGRPS